MLMNLLAVYLGQHFRNLAVGGNAHAIQLALVLLGHTTVLGGACHRIGGVLRRDAQLGDVRLGDRSSGSHMALSIHSGLVKAAGSSGMSGMDVLVCASRNAVQLMASVASRSESLQRKVLLTMRQLFEEARLNHLIIDNPTEGIKITPHAKAEKKKALLPDEVDILMSVVVEPRARVFCALCLYCGLRKEEALGLQWSDIQSNSLTVRRAMTFLNNQQDPVDDLKTKAAHRVIPIPDKLRAILLDTPHLSRYIVPASNGGDMTRSAFTRMWNSHVVSLVPFPLHPHMLRHTYATTLYRARVDLRTAQKLMGHSSIQVTADIYTHLEQEDSLHVADKLNEYLSGKSENSVKSSQKVVKLAI